MRWIPAKLCWQDDPTALGPRSNATRKEWYHGVKIHAFVMLWPGKLPIPCAFPISQASLCDLWVGKQIDLDCAPVANGKRFVDRDYTDAVWKTHFGIARQSNHYTQKEKTNGDFIFCPTSPPLWAIPKLLHCVCQHNTGKFVDTMLCQGDITTITCKRSFQYEGNWNCAAD